MALFQSSNQPALRPHLHVAEECCPLCEQPIAREVARRIEAKKREQYQAALEQARAEAAVAAEQKVEAARHEARQAAETVMLAKLAEIHSKLAEAEQAKETLQKERDAAVLAEQAKHFEAQQKWQATIQDLQRQLDRKSAHELGEVAEIDLFEQLKAAFEGDRIVRVGKGVNGADVIHEVVHNGKVCGKIIYDCKNRNAWQNEFAAKLNMDKLAERADHAVLSSNKFPKGAQQLHHQDGVIVANPARVLTLAELLRRHIVQTHELRVSNHEREQKTATLYAFITSERCRQLLDSIESQSNKMLELEAVEEKAHRRTWDQRAKLIQSVKRTHGDLCFEIERIIGTAGE